jgi:hypothetical protein
MDNLTITRNKCNNFTFTYTNTIIDLILEVRTIPTISTWDGDYSTLPIYLTTTIEKVIFPNVSTILELDLPNDGIYVFMFKQPINIDKWYLPSTHEAELIVQNLVSTGVITFPAGNIYYWTACQINEQEVVGIKLNSGTGNTFSGDTLLRVRPVSHFLSTNIYNIGDNIGIGYVYYIETLPNDYFKYYICSLTDLDTQYKYQAGLPLSIIGMLAADIGMGEVGTDYILSNEATGNAAKAAIDYTVEISDLYNNEYTIYSIFCNLLECRKNILLRVLNEIDNCKDECDCVDLYDYNAFNVIYETISVMYQDILSHLNINVINSILSTLELEQLVAFDELLTQAKKYCISCKQPCKNC